MTSALDAPVIADTLRKQAHIKRQAAEVVTNIRMLFAALEERVNDQPNGCESCPQTGIQKVLRPSN